MAQGLPYPAGALSEATEASTGDAQRFEMLKFFIVLAAAFSERVSAKQIQLHRTSAGQCTTRSRQQRAYQCLGYRAQWHH